VAGGEVIGMSLLCTSCALRENTPGRMLLVMGMIFMPWAVGAVSVLAIRKMNRRSQEP
jgi:hypothetical protein